MHITWLLALSISVHPNMVDVWLWFFRTKSVMFESNVVSSRTGTTAQADMIAAWQTEKYQCA